ncbi:protein of unknown function [Taphrina deformans PYCC 5710]|uniref:GPN-loop GTPase 3 n=1 Tax=Taphrina deformans (strain PYCC 5710 / ATCC 11124 / CBS 356.35 / IMI 108563 / JCM 9778 / NBRC 8474) TaxID=1097556 RepID=R4XH34_TAPDE|nr:protein of unknown function [Taphrina deformans PYCC 5710]|eukprot:CCG85003.1 protein of unknown function [Taphrina deformans PYCC 5710]
MRSSLFSPLCRGLVKTQSQHGPISRVAQFSTAGMHRLDHTKFVDTTRSVMCIGRNYVDHIKELGNTAGKKPFFFLKPPSSLVAPGAGPVLLPRGVKSHFEIELGLVIGKKVKDLSKADSEAAIDAVAGYFLAIDMTARNMQEQNKKKGLPWTTAKGFDTYLPVSKFIPKSQIPDPHNVVLKLEVNGVERQNDSTNLMIYQLPEILAHISSIMTLSPGDIVITGTPKGVGPVVHGDVMKGSLFSEGKEIEDARIEVACEDRNGGSAVLVMGPAGSGKSTFCGSLMSHIQNVGRRAHYVNLDPAAEEFTYTPTIDIKDLISLQDVMEELEYGPNGGLVYCFEFLMENLDWLDAEIGDFEEDYLIVDMPGQIELYTHIPILPALARHLEQLNFRLCATYLLESPFVIDKPKFFAGVMSAMSAMVMLEVPHINVLSKIDLVQADLKRSEMRRYLDPDPLLLLDDVNASTNTKFHDLNRAIVQLIDDFHMVSFLQLSSRDEESVSRILSYIDDCTQWAEDQEPQMKDDPEEREVDDDNDD